MRIKKISDVENQVSGNEETSGSEAGASLTETSNGKAKEQSEKKVISLLLSVALA